MRRFFGRVAAWFTPTRRQLIQVLFGSLAPLAILFGFGTDGSWEQWLLITGAGLQFASSTLSLVNVRDVVRAWQIVRGAVYAAGAVIAPALVALGYLDEALSARILLGISLGLTFLSNALAVLVGSKQAAAE